MRAYNLGVRGRIFTKFYQGMWLIVGLITWTQILQGCRLQNFGWVKKRPKFSAIFNNFRVWSQISPEWIDKSNIG